jgi:hypothetical protein
VCLEKDRQETLWSWHSIGVRGPEKGRCRFGGDDKEFQEQCGPLTGRIRSIENPATSSGIKLATFRLVAQVVNSMKASVTNDETSH